MELEVDPQTVIRLDLRMEDFTNCCHGIIIVGTVLDANTLITKASCVRIQSVDAEALIKRAPDYFRPSGSGLVSRDRISIREKIETESNIRKWLQDLTRLRT